MKSKRNSSPLTPDLSPAVKPESPMTNDPLPTSNQTAIAVSGSGYWGRNLVRNFHQLGVLKIICDQSSAIRQQMAKDYPDALVTDDFNAVLSDPAIQAVVISAPAVQHHALATQALNAGKHCFVEKPLSLTYDEGVALVCLAEAKKKILFVGHILQYHPAVVRLKALINKGTIWPPPVHLFPPPESRQDPQRREHPLVFCSP